MSAFDRSPSIAPPSRRRGWLPRFVAASVAAVMVGVTAVAVVSSPAAAATVDTNAWYVLINRNSGKALDVYNLATNDGRGSRSGPATTATSSSGSSSTRVAATTG